MAKPYSKHKVLGNATIDLMTKGTTEFTPYNTNYWILRNGDVIKISDLRKTHIQGILETLKENPDWRSAHKPALEHELKMRSLPEGKAKEILYGKKY